MRLFLMQTSSMKMLKPGFPGLFLCWLLFIAACLERPKPGRLRYDTDTLSTSPRGSRCYGDPPCTACLDCSQCKYCNDGGKCKNPANTGEAGEHPKKGRHPGNTIANGTTCKAQTKKGKRCKRSPRESGYCYQHEDK